MAVRREKALICLYDIAKVIRSSSDYGAVLGRVTSVFNTIMVNHLPGRGSQKYEVEFVGMYSEEEPSDEVKRTLRKLEYPVYLFKDYQAESVKVVHRIMKAYGIKEDGKTYELAKEKWRQLINRGLGIQPQNGYRKVAFVRPDRLDVDFERRRAITNVMVHEIGHMLNLGHGGCIMTEGTPDRIIRDPKADFCPEDKPSVGVEVFRLVGPETEKELDRKYYG